VLLRFSSVRGEDILSRVQRFVAECVESRRDGLRVCSKFKIFMLRKLHEVTLGFVDFEKIA